MPTDELDRYRRRGDLGDAPVAGPDPADSPLFVVQEHAASTRHFGLRLKAGVRLGRVPTDAELPERVGVDTVPLRRGRLGH